MKKKVFFLLALLIPFFVFSVIKIYNFILIDPAIHHGQDVVNWNGVTYITASFEYKQGAIIAKTKDGVNVRQVLGDKELNAIVLEEWLYQELFVRKGYQVPTEGKITAITHSSNEITDEDFYHAMEQIIASQEKTFIYKTDNLGYETSEITLFFDYSPLGIQKEIGFIQNKWIYVDNYSFNNDHEDDTGQYVANCKEIPDQYVPIIEKFISKK